MIYHNNYIDDCIHGTLDQKQWHVETQLNAVFLLCSLTITYNGSSFSNDFEVPFFNNNAKLKISQYVHSIMSLNFTLPSISKTNITVHSFPLATISYNLKEKDGTTELSDTSGSFYMTLGHINDPSLTTTSIDAGNTKLLLNAAQSGSLDDDSLASYSFIATNLPTKLISNDLTSDQEDTISSGDANYYLHTVTIPISIIIRNGLTAYTLKLEFADASILYLGAISIVDNNIENKLMAYQNSNGALSLIHFYGIFEIDGRNKTKTDNYTNDFNHELRETSISQSNSYELRTGFIWDEEKYLMLDELIYSFNKFIDLDGFVSVVNDGGQKLQPFKTRNYTKSEMLKFKKSKNDNTIYGIF